MNGINSFLTDWGIRFLENKDSIRKEIAGIDKNCDGFDFIINCKDKAKCFIVMPLLEDDIFTRLKEDSYFGAITLNNPANIRFVAGHWDKLASFKFLSIYFVNPFSESDKAWAIIPQVHNKICDRASLELGLKSIAEMVAPLGVEELNNKVRLLREESGL